MVFFLLGGQPPGTDQEIFSLGLVGAWSIDKSHGRSWDASCCRESRSVVSRGFVQNFRATFVTQHEILGEKRLGWLTSRDSPSFSEEDSCPRDDPQAPLCFLPFVSSFLFSALVQNLYLALLDAGAWWDEGRREEEILRVRDG